MKSFLFTGLYISFLVFFVLLKIFNGTGAHSYSHYHRYVDDESELKFPEDIKQATSLLNDAYKKIETLEEKIMSLEGRMPKTYPDVRFLNYLNRKRILVSILFRIFVGFNYFFCPR